MAKRSKVHVQVDASTLGRALSQAAAVASKKSTMPVLASVLVEAVTTPEGGRLIVTASDLETVVVAQLACEVLVEGRACVPAQLLRDVAKRLPGTVAVLQFIGNRLGVTCEATEYELATLPADEFPALPAVTPDRVIRGTVEDLLAAIDSTRVAASHDDTRYNLCGVHVDAEGDRLSFVATDGHRLALAETQASHGPTAGLTIAHAGIDALRGILLEGSAGDVEIGLAPNAITVTRGGVTVTSRLIDGQFPDYRQVIPTEVTHEITVPRARLIEALDRVAVLGNDATGVNVLLRKNTLRLEIDNSDRGIARETLIVDFGGKPVGICLKPQYLADALKALDTDQVTIGLTDELSPVLITGNGRRHVVMPMRGDADEKAKKTDE
jgi:DNA polymerase-3 subunit beta